MKFVSTTDTAHPLFIRVPAEGGSCPVCGLSKNAINGVILGDDAPVASFTLSGDGDRARRGARFIIADSLVKHLRPQAELRLTDDLEVRALPLFIRMPRTGNCPLTGFTRSQFYALKRPPVRLRMISVDAHGRPTQAHGRQLVAVADLLEVILRFGDYDEPTRDWLCHFLRLVDGRAPQEFEPPRTFTPRYLEEDLLMDEMEERLAFLGLPSAWVRSHPGLMHAVQQVVEDFEAEPVG